MHALPSFTSLAFVAFTALLASSTVKAGRPLPSDFYTITCEEGYELVSDASLDINAVERTSFYVEDLGRARRRIKRTTDDKYMTNVRGELQWRDWDGNNWQKFIPRHRRDGWWDLQSMNGGRNMRYDSTVRRIDFFASHDHDFATNKMWRFDAVEPVQTSSLFTDYYTIECQQDGYKLDGTPEPVAPTGGRFRISSRPPAAALPGRFTFFVKDLGRGRRSIMRMTDRKYMTVGDKGIEWRSWEGTWNQKFFTRHRDNDGWWDIQAQTGSKMNLAYTSKFGLGFYSPHDTNHQSKELWKFVKAKPVNGQWP